MHFSTKNYLKSTRNHIAKHANTIERFWAMKLYGIKIINLIFFYITFIILILFFFKKNRWINEYSD